MIRANLAFLSLTFILIYPQAAFASTKIEATSGADASFNTGYAERSFGEAFHVEETYGLPDVLVSEKEAWIKFKER